LLVLLEDGLDLGRGYSIASTSFAQGLIDGAPFTEVAVTQVKNLRHLLKPPTTPLFYQVKVTNPENKRSCNYEMLVDTGSSRSAVPGAYTMIGVSSGGSESTVTHTGMVIRQKSGVVEMELIARAYEDGFDAQRNQKWRYELPTELVHSIHSQGSGNPKEIAKLEGVAVIGLSTLTAWNVCVHPVPCENLTKV